MDGWCGETGPNWWPLAKITICQKEQAEHQGVPFQSEFQSERTKTFPADLSWAPRAHLLKLASCADSRINRMRSAARRPVWLNARVKRKLPFSNSFFLLHLHLGSRRRNERREGCKECSLLPASRAQNNNSQAAAKDAIHVHRNLYIYIFITCRQQVKFFRVEHALPLNFSMKNYTRRSLMFMSARAARMLYFECYNFACFVYSYLALSRDYDR